MFDTLAYNNANHNRSSFHGGRTSMPYIISVVNQKGGVGKTTVVVNLSAALARLGYLVLVVDLDPQANASTTMGLMDPYEVKSTTATVMLDKTESVAPWYDTIEDHVQLVYGHVQLTKAERELPRISTTMPGLVLKKRLSRMALADDHLVFIDCPPSLSLLTVNALVASDYCLIPMESGSKYSLDGYEDLEELIRDVKDVNTDLDILGVLITKHDGRKNVCKAMKSAIERRFGYKVFATSIASAAKIQEAETKKKTVFQLDRQSTGARDFMELGREVLARLRLQPIKVPSADDGDEPPAPADVKAAEGDYGRTIHQEKVGASEGA
jgi:chromosome partitioning protein